MNPYSVNPHRDDEYLVPKRDRRGNVVHHRRRRAKGGDPDARFFLASGIAMAVLFGAMLADWVNTPMG